MKEKLYCVWTLSKCSKLYSMYAFGRHNKLNYNDLSVTKLMQILCVCYYSQEAKDLPGVGTRLADKIWEIAESGELRKLNEFRSSDEVKIMEMFGNVWGAGAHTSRVWYQQVSYRQGHSILSTHTVLITPTSGA